MQAGDRTRAAIASKRAAEIYGGQILREHLEDDPENYTRFLLLAPATEASPEKADKLSLVFRLAHLPGALYHALEPFARRNINLMKIESRPVRGLPWQYRFYLDLQASTRDPEVAGALAELGEIGSGCADSGFLRFGKGSEQRYIVNRECNHDRQHGDKRNGRTN